MRGWLVLVSLLLAVPPVTAEERRTGFGDWNNSFTWENDKPFESDRFYTNGIRYTMSVPREEAPVWADDLFTDLESFLLPDWPRRPTDEETIGFGFRHILLSPSGPTVSGVDLEDHPYDAWFGLSAFRHRDSFLTREELYPFEALRTTFGVGFGIIGSGAGGRVIQNNYHDLIGADDLIWDVQSRTEPTLMGTFAGAWRTRSLCMTELLCMDAIGRGGVSVGTPQTQVHSTFQVRLGVHLPKTFGTDVIDLVASSSVPGGAYEGRDAYDGEIPVGFHVFAGAEGRWLPIDIFLDGTVFRGERDGTTRPRPRLVADRFVGASLDLWRVSMLVTFVERTKTFDAQDVPHRFGSFQLRWLERF